MKELDLDSIGKKMPYRMPDHFIEEMTERVVSQIGTQRKQRKGRTIVALFASAASVAAVAVLLLKPFSGNLNIPDYDTISQCASVDEVFQTMSVDELGIYSMMSNYYGN